MCYTLSLWLTYALFLTHTENQADSPTGTVWPPVIVLRPSKHAYAGPQWVKFKALWSGQMCTDPTWSSIGCIRSFLVGKPMKTHLGRFAVLPFWVPGSVFCGQQTVGLSVESQSMKLLSTLCGYTNSGPKYRFVQPTKPQSSPTDTHCGPSQSSLLARKTSYREITYMH